MFYKVTFNAKIEHFLSFCIMNNQTIICYNVQVGGNIYARKYTVPENG